MSLTHEHLNRQFCELDKLQVMRETYFRQWLAWPIVKGVLWHAFLGYGSIMPSRSPTYVRAMGRVVRSIFVLVWHILSPVSKRIAIIHTIRSVSGSDNHTIHPHLGSLLSRTHLILEIVENWGNAGPSLSSTRSAIRHGDISILASALARILQWGSAVREVSATMEKTIAPFFPNIPPDLVRHQCQFHFAQFIAREVLVRIILWRFGIQTLLVFDSDSKCPEIAAAKTIGLPVYELQHGMFNREEPEYSWNAEYAGLRRWMPVPDRIVVFGPMWRHEILCNGFWGPNDVSECGYAALCRVPSAGKAQRQSGPLRVLFPTQYYTRAVAIEFWEAVLQMQETTAPMLMHLYVKIHPLEASDANGYLLLSRRFRNSCSIVPAGLDGFEALKCCDVVAGYTSFMLMEAVGLGKPAISLCGGGAPGGLNGTFNIPLLKRLIPHVDTPRAFLERLQLMVEASAGSTPDPVAAQRVFSFPARSFEESLLDILQSHYCPPRGSADAITGLTQEPARLAS